MNVAWARFDGHGMVNASDISDWKRQIRAWRKKARELAELVREYDKNWHGAMWDGQLIDEREVKAWAEIMKHTQAKGLR